MAGGSRCPVLHRDVRMSRAHGCAGATTLGNFLLFGQKKATKEKAARSRRLLPALLTRPGARLTRRAQNTRLGLDQKSRDTPEAGCDTRRRLRGWEQHLFPA